jgi:hypothetical protein
MKRVNFDKLSERKDKYILDENNNVIEADLMTWANFLENAKEKRIVNKEDVGDYHVSTVFLGLDHNFHELFGDHEEYKPHIFETMVFPKDGHENYCARCSTWKEAEKQHEIAVKWVLNGCKEEDR